jgi:glycosyltransferase involved in cell wall biosynthesis
VRIVYIHQLFATRDSDLGLIRSYEFARRWVAQGHDVTVITSSSRLPGRFGEHFFARGDIDGIDVRSVRVTYQNRMSYPRRLLSFAAFMLGATWLALRVPRPNVLFATSTPLTVGIPGVIASKLRRVPLVFEVRDLWPEAAIQMGVLRRGSLTARIAKSLERAIYRASAAVIALSPGMADGVLAEGVPAQRVHIVPNCCDLDLFEPGDKDAETVETYGLADTLVVGYTGAIGPSNAVESQLPAAARALHERGRDDITFLVVGDGKSLPALRDAVEGLRNVVVAGSLPKHDIPRITRTADVLLVLFADVPILATNSPNKLFDALASARPVIVNSAGWTKDLVEEIGCGLYVPASDGAGLADALERLADHPDLRAHMGHAARALAESRFARDDLAAQVLGVLEAAASTAASR